MAQAEEFDAPYLFKRSDVTVILRHSLGSNIRQKPGHPHHVDPDGGFGRLARWTITTRERDGGIEAQFRNEHAGGYLRIIEEGREIDCKGKGGPATWFRVHIQNTGYIKLESLHCEGKYLAVDKNGIRSGMGGPWCRLEILREGPKPPFSTPYLFLRENVVVIETRMGGHIKVGGEHDHSVQVDGGVGEFARFEAIPDGDKVQLKSVKNGKYLRIKEGHVDCGGGGGKFTHFKVHPVDCPNQVRLQSIETGRFIHLNDENKGLRPGEGKHKSSFFTFYRND